MNDRKTSFNAQAHRASGLSYPKTSARAGAYRANARAYYDQDLVSSTSDVLSMVDKSNYPDAIIPRYKGGNESKSDIFRFSDEDASSDTSSDATLESYRKNVGDVKFSMDRAHSLYNSPIVEDADLIGSVKVPSRDITVEYTDKSDSIPDYDDDKKEEFKSRDVAIVGMAQDSHRRRATQNVTTRPRSAQLTVSRSYRKLDGKRENQSDTIEITSVVTTMEDTISEGEKYE